MTVGSEPARERREVAGGRRAPARPRTARDSVHDVVLALQRSAGNGATSLLLGGRGVVVQRTVASANALTGRTFTSLAEWIAHLRTLVDDPTYDAVKAALVEGLDPPDKDMVEALLTAQEVADEDVVDDGEDEVFSDEDSGDEEYEEVAADPPPAATDDEDLDEDFVDANAPDPKGRKRKRVAKKKKVDATYTTKDTFRGDTKKRRKAVTGEVESIPHVSGPVHRPRRISGRVEPRATKGRPGAPEPFDIRVGVKWKEVGSFETRNTGIVDAQKGHIFALELGGPDKSWNIVPQWGNFQANGEWRKAETRIHDMAVAAEEAGKHLWFEAKVLYKHYLKPEQATLKGLTFPTGFTVTVFYEDAKGEPVPPGIVVFDGAQYQDHTDRKVANRALDKADGVVTEESSGKKRK